MTQSGKPKSNPKPSSRPQSTREKSYETWLQGVPPTENFEFLLEQDEIPSRSRNIRLPTSWFVVVVPDAGQPEVLAFQEIDQVVDRLKDLLGSEASVLVFCGTQSIITDGPFHYLRHPDGTAIPLFRLAPPQGAANSGYLGDKPLYRTDPDDLNLDPMDEDEDEDEGLDVENLEDENPEDPEDVPWS